MFHTYAKNLHGLSKFVTPSSCFPVAHVHGPQGILIATLYVAQPPGDISNWSKNTLAYHHAWCDSDFVRALACGNLFATSSAKMPKFYWKIQGFSCQTLMHSAVLCPQCTAHLPLYAQCCGFKTVAVPQERPDNMCFIVAFLCPCIMIGGDNSFLKKQKQKWGLSGRVTTEVVWVGWRALLSCWSFPLPQEQDVPRSDWSNTVSQSTEGICIREFVTLFWRCR